MNAAYVSAFAALAGSLIGGLTTFAAAWVTQRRQANVQWLLQEKTRRQELYQQFVEEASKLYVDALIHDQAPIPALVSLYASINSCTRWWRVARWIRCGNSAMLAVTNFLC